MTWITQSRQRSVWLLLLTALLLSLSLAACGQQVNASSTNATNASNNNAASQQQQPYQPAQPAQSQSGNANTTTTTTNNLQSTDQQVQSMMNQLDGAHNDVDNSNAASSQDNGQQP